MAICAYTERRWDVLNEAVREASAQMRAGDELVLVIDHAPELLARATERFPAARVVANTRRPGLSGSRNTAVHTAGGEVVVFLDDDAVPGPGWLDALLAAYCDEGVIGVGGHVAPAWTGSSPAWFPDEFLWVVGCSYAGLPTGQAPIRNPIGANMSFRRAVLAATGPFSESLGRVGAVPVGCEETELSLRAHRVFPAGRILHEPSSIVFHRVSDDRATFAYFRRRCWSEGASKALVTRVAGRAGALATERAYVASTLTRAIARELRAALRGDVRAIARAGAVLAGTAVAAAGYLTHLRTPGRAA